MSREQRRWFLLVVGVIIIVLGPLALGQIFQTKSAQAAWANEDWGYRYPITVTNSTGSAQTKLQKLLTIDTSTLVTAGKLQSDCDDLRFTAQNGTVLPYYIDSGCNTTTTKVWVLIDNLPTNGSVIYMYYGNPNVSAGSNSKEFDNVVGLVGYWTMNDTSGSTATDSSVNANNGTATGTTIVSGQKGNARSFNGSSDYLNSSSTVNLSGTNVITLEFWMNATNLSTQSVALELGTNYNISTTAFLVAPNGRGDGKLQFSLKGDVGYNSVEITNPSSTTWHHYTIVFDKSKPGTTEVIPYVDGVAVSYTKNGDSNDNTNNFGNSTFYLGARAGSSAFFSGSLDDVRIYNTARTADQISSDYTKTYTIQTSPLTVTTANGSEEKAPSPVAYWKFDDGTGTTAQDSTTNNNDGTLTNGPSWQTEDMCVSGKCLKFDGTDDYLDLTNTIQFDSGNFTISGWFKTGQDSTSSYKQIWMSGYNGGNPDVEILMNNNKLSFYVRDSAGSANSAGGILSTNTLNDNKWHFFTAVRSSNTFILYVDGVQNSTVTAALGDVDTAGVIPRMGNGIGACCTSRYFNGFIDEPKIYNYARSADQIKADYNARANSEGAALRMDSGSGPGMTLSNGLVGYWKMDQSSWNGTAGEVLDSSGNGRNATSAGSATTTAGKYGNGGSFNGSTQYAKYASTSGLSGDVALTMSVWVKTTNVATGPQMVLGVIGATNATGINSAIFVNPSGVSGSVGYHVGSCGQDTAGSLLTNSTWAHIAVVKTPGALSTTTKIYINGVERTTTNVLGDCTPNITGTKINIGAGWWDADTTYPFAGTADEARIYNRALSPAEVTQLYNFAPGPVAYYNFEENTGTTVNDRSGNGNTGTWNGSGSPKWKPGKYGSAGNFDGSSDYVRVTDNGTLRPTGTITVGSWIYPTAVNGLYEIYRYDNAIGGDTNRHLLSFQGGGSHCNGGSGPCLSFGISTGGTYAELDVNITASDYLNKWNYVVATYDGATKKIYTNGVLIGSASASGAIGQPSVSDTLNIGRSSEAAEYFKGQIDEVKIYNYARTQDQIISDMQGSSGTAAFSLSSSGLTAGSNTKPAAPVGYWRFDEGYGTTANNVGNGGSSLNGTLTNMASPATSTSGWTQSGKVGKALNFDGTNDYVTIANNSALNPSTSMAISAWIKPTNLSPGATGYQLVIKWGGTSAQSQYHFWINASGILQFHLQQSNGTQVLPSGGTLTAGQWQHVAGVADAGTGKVRIYINAVEVASSSYNGTINSGDGTANDVGIGVKIVNGSPNGEAGYFIGQMDEVKIYNFALTADQVKMDMNQGAAQVLGALGDNSSSSSQEYCIPGDTATCSAPVARWDFDEATGTTANDSSGNANTGTLTNGPTWVNGKSGNGKAINFDGSNDYIDLGNNSSLGLSTFTISTWIKPTALSGYQLIYGRSSFPKLYTSGTSVQLYDGSVNPTASTTVTTGSWQHIVVVHDQVTTKFYINGVAAGSTANTTVYATGASQTTIGKDPASESQYFPGQIDDVRVYNYARTPAQIAWDYNKGAPVGHWRLDECQGTTANDASGNSNSGTITIGASGTQTTVGTCTDGASTSAWYNGRTGKRNYSLNFDGTDDYVSAADSSLLKPSSGITLSAWIKTSNISLCGKVIGKSDTTVPYPGYMMRVNTAGPGCTFSNGNLAFWTGDNTNSWLSVSLGSNQISDNNWHLITMTNDGTTSKIYFDGVLKTTATRSLSTSSTNSLRIGSDNFNDSSGNYFPGQIDDVRVYNYPLTATQVKNLMNEGAVRYGPVTGAP